MKRQMSDETVVMHYRQVTEYDHVKAIGIMATI
jgi:hypothetical protein